MARKTKKLKSGDQIVALKFIAGVADKGDLGLFQCYDDKGDAVCDFICVPISDGRVTVNPDYIMKVQRRSFERVKEIRKYSSQTINKYCQ